MKSRVFQFLALLTVFVLQLVAIGPNDVAAQAGGAKPAANLEITVDDQRDLDVILEESRSVDIDVENARLRTIAANNRADKVRAQYELVRLRILTSRKLDPAAFDVVYEPVEKNGVKANEWLIRPRATPQSSPPPAKP